MLFLLPWHSILLKDVYQKNVFVPITAVYALLHGENLEFLGLDEMEYHGNDTILSKLVDAMMRYDAKRDSKRLCRVLYHELERTISQGAELSSLSKSFNNIVYELLKGSVFAIGRENHYDTRMGWGGAYRGHLLSDAASFLIPYPTLGDICGMVLSPHERVCCLCNDTDLVLIHNALHVDNPGYSCLYYENPLQYESDEHYNRILTVLDGNNPDDFIPFLSKLQDGGFNVGFADIAVRNGFKSRANSPVSGWAFKMRKTSCKDRKIYRIRESGDGKYTWLYFDLENRAESVMIGETSVPYEDFERKEFIWDEQIYQEPCPVHGGASRVRLSDIASINKEVYGDKDLESLIPEEIFEEYENAVWNEHGEYSSKYGYEMVIPNITNSMSDIVSGNGYETHKHPITSRIEIVMGPCVLYFYERSREGAPEVAVINIDGPFLLSEQVRECYGEFVSFYPEKSKISPEYLALVLLNDYNLLEIFKRIGSKLDAPEEVLDIAVAFDPITQQEAIRNAVAQEKLRKGKGSKNNVLWIEDSGECPQDTMSYLEDNNIRVVRSIKPEGFSKELLESMSGSASTHVDAVVFDTENMDRFYDLLTAAEAFPAIQFFIYHTVGADTLEREFYRAIRKYRESGRLIERCAKDSALHLASGISESVSEHRQAASEVLNKYFKEFQTTEELGYDAAARILTEALKDDFVVNPSRKHTEDRFTPLRQILERMFRSLIKKGILPNLKIGAIADFLNDQKYVDYTTGYCYTLTTQSIPSAISRSLKYLKDVLNGGSHVGLDGRTTMNVVDWVSDKGTDNLYKAAIHILLDVLLWYKELCESTDGGIYKSVNFYEYKGVVEKDAKGVLHVDNIKVVGESAKEGDRIRITGVGLNKEEGGYPFYTSSRQYTILQ